MGARWRPLDAQRLPSSAQRRRLRQLLLLWVASSHSQQWRPLDARRLPLYAQRRHLRKLLLWAAGARARWRPLDAQRLPLYAQRWRLGLLRHLLLLWVATKGGLSVASVAMRLSRRQRRAFVVSSLPPTSCCRCRCRCRLRRRGWSAAALYWKRCK